MINRQLKDKLVSLAKSFRMVGILGPRQSGKTTLSKLCFPGYTYVNLEIPDIRAFAEQDPRGFLKTHTENFEKNVIFDEIQRVPSLFSYLQAHVDEHPRKGQFVLTGSQNFLLSEKIAQSLSGRVALCTLLPCSIAELKQAQVLPKTHEEAIFNGFYPSVYAEQVVSYDWYVNYLITYVERDVRQMKNITNLSLFEKFLKSCAGRIGQVLNFTSLASDCGISVNTAKEWISLLEASFILFTLQPYYKNFNKRLIKSPKLFFHDTGLACMLLGIHSPSQLSSHYMRGHLFESMMISDLMKHRYNQGLQPNIYFWRDQVGNEIDCILEQEGQPQAVEIKAGETVSSDYFDTLKKWYKIAHVDPKAGFVIYAGDETQQRTLGSAIGWKNIDTVFKAGM